MQNEKQPFESRLGFASVIFLIVAGIGFLFITGRTDEQSPLPESSKNIIGVVLFFGGCLASMFFLWRRRAREQPLRDQYAQELFHELVNKSAKGNPGRFYLYLRAFLTTNRFTRETKNIEMLLGESVEPDPFIALGAHGECIGAGRIDISENEWQNAVLLLARNATGIFLVPAYRPGTMWEIDQIFADQVLREKTTFVMIPRVYFSWDGIDFRQHWEQARSELAQKGIFLPMFHKDGLLFRLGDNGRVCEKKKIGVGGMGPLI